MLISFHNRYNLLTKIENMRLGSARLGSGLGFAFGLVPNAANANECQYEYECVNSERIVRGCVRVCCLLTPIPSLFRLLRIGMPVKLCVCRRNQTQSSRQSHNILIEVRHELHTTCCNIIVRPQRNCKLVPYRIAALQFAKIQSLL